MTSKVSFQVMWNRLISIVEEQAQALVRTAFSTSVREAGDLSAGVYNRHGEMIAQAVTGTPGHVNAMYSFRFFDDSQIQLKRTGGKLGPPLRFK